MAGCRGGFSNRGTCVIMLRRQKVKSTVVRKEAEETEGEIGSVTEE